MLTMSLKAAFVLIAVLLTLMTVYGKCFVFRKKHPAFVSDYCAVLAVFLGLYVILSFVLVWVFPHTSAKLVMLAFALAPFLIGMLATFHTEKYYTALQVGLFVLSIFFVI